MTGCGNVTHGTLLRTSTVSEQCTPLQVACPYWLSGKSVCLVMQLPGRGLVSFLAAQVHCSVDVQGSICSQVMEESHRDIRTGVKCTCRLSTSTYYIHVDDQHGIVCITPPLTWRRCAAGGCSQDAAGPLAAGQAGYISGCSSCSSSRRS
jgi:hypothetical protein